MNPKIINITAVAEHILALQIQDGWVEGGVQIPYEPQEGETLEVDKQIPYLTWICKEERVGVLVKDTIKGDQRFELEKRCGTPLKEALADETSSYLVNGRKPLQVWRKTKPNNVADPSYEPVVEHYIYLVLAEKLAEGKEYQVKFADSLFTQKEWSYMHLPKKQFSEAVHVTQLGFHPQDPSKKAYLSQWMGLGGGISYREQNTFHILKEENDEIVYTGNIVLQQEGTPVVFHNRPTDKRSLDSDELTVGSPVYEMDFSKLKTEGMYRVYVPGIGCSFSFVLDKEQTWLRGFKLSVKALYHQRSGIVTGAPYSEFERPRVYHPEDGRVIRQSECSLFESGNGLNCYGTDVNNFGNLVRKKTDTVVENAWGGYFDACDWDRRIQHLRATNYQLELFLMFPEYFRELDLNIPESGNGIPDIINEGLYNIDFYRRLQLPEGGIRGGIEAEEHPILGQCGWQDSWPAYAYAPDFWSSHWYASAAARAAVALKEIDREKSTMYAESAIRAFQWAEKEYAELVKAEGHKWIPAAHKGAKDARELAAVELYRLTGEACYDRIYREIRQDKSYDAAFVYASLPDGVGDAVIKAECVRMLVKAAKRAVAFAETTPFRLTTPDPEITRTGSWGSFYTVAKSTELMRAHYLTGEETYLAAAIDACNFACGANPSNLCYTTGVGPRCPVNVLHHDSRLTGQPVPEGITVFGPQNMRYSDRDGFVPFIKADCFWPGVYGWPAVESYFDAYRIAPENEYTVQGSIGPNLYNWGYLAAAGRRSVE